MNYMMMNQMQIQQQMHQQQIRDIMNMQANTEITNQQMLQQLNLDDFLNYYNYMTRVSPNPFKTSLECVTESKKLNKALIKTGQFLLSSKGLGNSAYVSFKSKAIYTLAVRDGNKYIREANAAVKKGNKAEALKNLKAAKACFEKAIKSVRDGANSHTLFEKVAGDMITGGLMSYLSDTFRTFRAAKELKEYGEFGESWGKELKKQGVLKIINAFTLGFSGYIVFKKRRKVNQEADKAVGKIDKTKLNQFKNDTLYLLRVYLQVVNEMITNLERNSNVAKENFKMNAYNSDVVYENLMDLIDEPVTEGKNIETNRALTTALSKGKKLLHEANMATKAGKYKEAKKLLQEAKNCFEDGVDAIHSIPDGILADTIIQFYASLFVGTYKMFKESSDMKLYGRMGRDWGSKLVTHGVVRIIGALTKITLIGDVARHAEHVMRRIDNTDSEAKRGKYKQWTFNGFKEDCLFILNGFIETTDELIDKVDEFERYGGTHSLNESYTYDNKIDELLESAF